MLTSQKQMYCMEGMKCINNEDEDFLITYVLFFLTIWSKLLCQQQRQVLDTPTVIEATSWQTIVLEAQNRI